MKKVILADGTIISNCTDSTTTNEIYVLRESYGDAGAVRDLFNQTNASLIKVEDENGDLLTKNANLVLLEDVSISPVDGGYVCLIKTRVKTEMEIMKDEIAELQEAIIIGE